MKYKVVIRFRDRDGNIKEESVPFSVLSEQDAELKRHFNEELAEKRYGKANVISVTLDKIEQQYNESDVINAIKVQFTDENAKVFLKRFWQKKRKDNGINETGFCYWASHAYFHFMGGKPVGLCVKKWPNPMVENEGHFWVEKASGERIDLTKEQYRNVGGFNHYNDGKPARQPNKNGRILKFISLVEAELEK